MSRRIPDLWLEQYALGELPPDQAAELESALGAELPTRVAALAADGQDLLRRLPPRVMASRLRPIRLRRGVPVLALAGALAAIATVSVVTRPPNPAELPSPAADDGVIAKGLHAALVAHRKVGSGSEPLDDGAMAQAGDRLQLSTVVTEPLYGMVLSVDGRGIVTVHEGVGGAVALEPGGPTLLPRSYVLDDAPRFERFFLVTSAEPFPTEPILAAARALRGPDDLLALPPGLDQTSFTVVKP